MSVRLSPLGELFGKGAVLAVGEILKTEVLIDLEQRLVVADMTEPRLGRLRRAEEPERAALDLFVRRGVAQLEVGFVGHAVLVHRQRGEVVCDQFQRLGAAEQGDFR